jgi:hypothetical protein
MTMTKKQKDWQQLHEFISWEYYDAMSTVDLAQLCHRLRDQIDSVTQQMDRAEIIVGRSRRARATVNARALLSRLQEILQQTSKVPTHTHQL